LRQPAPSAEPVVVERRNAGSAAPLVRPAGHEFDAELDGSELDDRDRPGPTWTAHGKRLSRSNLSFRTRRMSYAGRRLLLAIHLIDSQPVPLFGVVRTCEYDGEGMYLMDLDLMPVPDKPDIQEWLHQVAKGR
jgi:hypothetical protein